MFIGIPSTVFVIFLLICFARQYGIVAVLCGALGFLAAVCAWFSFLLLTNGIYLVKPLVVLASLLFAGMFISIALRADRTENGQGRHAHKYVKNWRTPSGMRKEPYVGRR